VKAFSQFLASNRLRCRENRQSGDCSHPFQRSPVSHASRGIKKRPLSIGLEEVGFDHQLQLARCFRICILSLGPRRAVGCRALVANQRRARAGRSFAARSQKLRSHGFLGQAEHWMRQAKIWPFRSENSVPKNGPFTVRVINQNPFRRVFCTPVGLLSVSLENASVRRAPRRSREAVERPEPLPIRTGPPTRPPFSGPLRRRLDQS
jgi:hypothetical protein